MSPFRPILFDPALRLAALAIFLVGAIAATFAPHASVLAVHTFGLGDAGYAVLLVFSMVLSVSASIYVGIRSDQTANRRRVAVAAAGIWVCGLALMTLIPGPVTFILAHAVLLPLASTLFVQIFALARLAASRFPADARDGIMSTIRAVFAAPFVIVLPLWAVAFESGAAVMTIYPVSLVMAGVILLLTLAAWPKDGKVSWADAPSGLSFRAALRELTQAPLAWRVLALGAVSVGSTLYIAVIGLLMTSTEGRGPSDAALFVGLVAGLEVPFMLILPLVAKGVSRTRQLLVGTLIYGVHMLLLPVLVGSWLVWLLILPAAAGGAVTLTVPIAYLQDLLAARPGTGSSLVALQQLAANLLAACCFALGTAVSGYALALVIGCAVAVAGAAGLSLADRTITPSGPLPR
jgi:hypothetical protein